MVGRMTTTLIIVVAVILVILAFNFLGDGLRPVKCGRRGLPPAGRSRAKEASYACGATRAETLIRVILPAASSGICAAIILGLMRAVDRYALELAIGDLERHPEVRLAVNISGLTAADRS